MSFAGIFAKYSRFLFNPIQQCTTRNFFANTSPLAFRITDVLLGEPLKKKKRLDPAVIRRREERKLKKIQKSIRRLEKHARKLKPISECEIPFKLLDEKERRTRPPQKLSEEELDRRIILQKEWSRHKRRQSVADLDTMDSMIVSQQKALKELRLESEELYQAAIQIDMTMLPHSTKGPVGIVQTPPILNYSSPDGEYIDVTKRYDGQDEIEAEINAPLEDEVQAQSKI